MPATLTPEARAVVESGRLAHFTTIAADGRPHTTIVWVGLDGDEIVIGKLMPDQKVANIGRDPRVSVSIEADGDQLGMSVIGVSSSWAASRAVFRGRSPRLATHREVDAALAWPT